LAAGVLLPNSTAKASGTPDQTRLVWAAWLSLPENGRAITRAAPLWQKRLSHVSAGKVEPAHPPRVEGGSAWCVRRSATAATCRWWRAAASSASSRPSTCCSASFLTLDAQADQHAQNVLPLIREVQAAGAQTLAEIADALNARGMPTARSGSWARMTVKHVLDRAG
jgi:hypothetical protein